MPLARITVWGYRCSRCAHCWVPRHMNDRLDPAAKKPSEHLPRVKPRICPACKSAYWDVPKNQT